MAARKKLKTRLVFWGMGCWGGKFEFRQMLKTTREHCKKLMQVSIDSEINICRYWVQFRMSRSVCQPSFFCLSFIKISAFSEKKNAFSTFNLIKPLDCMLLFSLFFNFCRHKCDRKKDISWPERWHFVKFEEVYVNDVTCIKRINKFVSSVNKSVPEKKNIPYPPPL